MPQTRPKLIYDARWIRPDGTMDGVSRYSIELLKALNDLDHYDITLLYHAPSQLEHLPELPTLRANDPGNIIQERTLPWRLNQLKPDVVYSPFFIMGARGRQYRLVLTIHDLIYFTHRTPPHWLPPHVRLAWRLFHLSHMPLRKLLDSADAVATVSQTAADELRAARATTRPLAVVPNAVQPPEHVTINPARSASNDVLYMGAFTQYKNVELLIKALKHLPGVRLQCLSKIPRSRKVALETLARTHGVAEQVIFRGGVSDEEYQALLADCRCLVSASKLEGFGLPLIEAGSRGVPIAVADTPIFREVAGDSALYFPTDDAPACARAIQAFAETDTSVEYARRGIENARRFSWQQSAEAAARVIDSLAGS